MATMAKSLSRRDPLMAKSLSQEPYTAQTPFGLLTVDLSRVNPDGLGSNWLWLGSRRS
jgi:hypothetical protein